MADEPTFGRFEHHFRCQEWFISFKRSTPIRIAQWLTIGQEFKHVSCFGFIPATGCWLFHDWCSTDTGLWVVPDQDADRMLSRAQDDAVIVRFVPPLFITRDRFKIGMWCVPSVAHLTGVNSCALRPDALFRDVLAQGGEIIIGKRRADASEGQTRSRASPATAGSPA